MNIKSIINIKTLKIILKIIEYAIFTTIVLIILWLVASYIDTIFNNIDGCNYQKWNAFQLLNKFIK